MDVEAPGADRLQSGLAHRHPVGLAELLDLRFAASKRGNGLQLGGSRLVVEIGVDQPFVRLRRIRLVGDKPARLFFKGEAPRDLAPEESLQFLLR